MRNFPSLPAAFVILMPAGPVLGPTPAGLLAATAVQEQSETPKKSGPAVSVPVFPNVSCPIMGKPISLRLYTDTEFGRIYICCKSCIKDIRNDPALAYATAYPTTRAVENERCPITGQPIEDSAPRMALQGREFSVCCQDCVPKAQKDAQAVLAKVEDEKLVDLQNSTCPVTGEPVSENVLVIIEGHLVRLSSSKAVAEVEKDPAGRLRRAQEIAKRQESERKKQVPARDGEERRDA